MTDRTYLGRCLCRAVRYRVTGTVRDLCYCHCESCRRATGSAFVAWGTTDCTNFTITQGALTIVHSSSEVERGFCVACGSTLTYSHTRRSGEIDFTLVSLENPSALQPQAHIWVRDKLPWVRIDDGLPQFQTVLGSSV